MVRRAGFIVIAIVYNILFVWIWRVSRRQSIFGGYSKHGYETQMPFPSCTRFPFHVTDVFSKIISSRTFKYTSCRLTGKRRYYRGGGGLPTIVGTQIVPLLPTENIKPKIGFTRNPRGRVYRIGKPDTTDGFPSGSDFSNYVLIARPFKWETSTFEMNYMWDIRRHS